MILYTEKYISYVVVVAVPVVVVEVVVVVAVVVSVAMSPPKRSWLSVAAASVATNTGANLSSPSNILSSACRYRQSAIPCMQKLLNEDERQKIKNRKDTFNVVDS